MQWTETLNKVIDYIEGHLTDEINNDAIEKIAGASFYNFQRVFVFIFNMSVAEYIRYRRLSLAAVDLIESDSKILDIALKYGYETHESFSRAFIQFHGVLPSDAKVKDDDLKYCYKAEIETNIKANVRIGRLKEISVHHILNNAKIKKTHEIELTCLLPNDDTGTFNIYNGELTATCKDDKFSLLTADEYPIPLKIDLTAKTDNTNLKLLFGKGDLTLNWQYSDWKYKLNELMIHDIITSECFGYPDKGQIKCDSYISISWIITKEFMALILDGELRYYNEYLPYITHFLKNTDKPFRLKFGVAPAWGSTIAVKCLCISEL
ncbi:MAG: AraC family transcriptional regulator [Clostridiales bacterium]|nr:AraC family transcriptional regulator [Clostridiales bacterium]